MLRLMVGAVMAAFICLIEEDIEDFDLEIYERFMVSIVIDMDLWF